MKINRKFTKDGQDPFASVAWTRRSSRITNPDGSVVFEMKDAEVPETWSQLATDIMVSKYFRKAGVPNADGSSGPEKSARQVIHRLAGCWRHWGEKHQYFDSADDAQAFYDELVYMMVHQMAAPNSPQWFNTGLAYAYGITGPAQGHFVVDPRTGEVSLADDAYTHPQPHACFIQSVDDDLVNEGGIMDLWVREARLFKYGSGTGTNFSHLRGEGEKLSGGGKSSGLMSWLRIGDRAASAIKSGGTTRRAAKMVCLDMDHPDISSFINWKVREEIKVQALVEGLRLLKKSDKDLAETCEKLGLTLDYDFNGEAYQTVSGQNSNNSVRIPDSFFDAVDQNAEWKTTWRTSTKTARSFEAKRLWDEICYAAWRCADPGVQFDSTINAWHTCPSAGRINASNPCVTGDTLVATSTGPRRIKNLVGPSAEIVNAHGDLSFVDRIFKTGTKPVYELKTSSGYTLRLTADHKVATVNRGDVPACELTIDDIVTLRGARFGDEFVPESFGELLGAAVGDGCVSRGESQDFLSITVDHAERPVAERLRSHLDECKGWLARDARSRRPSTITDTPTTLRVGTSVEPLVERLSDLAVLDQGSHAKAFRDAVFALDRRSTAAILRGLFTADGSVADYAGKSQYVALDSTSLELLRQVQLLLLSFGIKAKLYENRRAAGPMTALLPDGKGGQREYAVRQVHSLRISRSSRIIFEREIGFMPGSAKRERLAALNARVIAYADRLVDRVASLTPAGVEDVFDLTEPVTSHFVANGVVVHNCSEYMFLDNTACNLASLNVLKFYDAKARQFDVERYEHAIDVWTIVLEISVLMAAFPSRPIAELSYKYRTLGLGYANLGAMLMQAGIAYDSDEARAICATLSAILTGRSYRMSAQMAREHGPFPGFKPDRDNMLRVIRNHRAAAHGEARDSTRYENLKIRPVPIDHALIAAGNVPLANVNDLAERSKVAWDEALSLGEQYGYRNAQVTVIAPTGTIGLLMDCDTTGVEPDFALVKFKKLAGGGYFKIANESVAPALAAMGYTAPQIRDIMTYLLGSLSFDVPMPAGTKFKGTLRAWLLSKGLKDDEVKTLEGALPSVFELSFAFGAWSVGDEALARMGVDAAKAKADFSFNLLKNLGLTPAQIDELNTLVCGTQTIEGAPHLTPQHVAVFDCANTCGKIGKRFIAPEGHIRMMAAAQPFISGAISKTINLPNKASVEDIGRCYRMSWELGLKANALYRDGCKLSQPLSSTSDQEKSKDATPETASHPTLEAKDTTSSPQAVAETLVAAASSAPTDFERSFASPPRPNRRRLPDTRRSLTHKFNVAGHEGYLTVGLYDDGRPGELFITMSKEGSTIGGLMDSLGTATSVALQYGVPIESLVTKFSHQRFEPAGMTENADIPFAKSLVDYIFRWMGMQFIPGYRETHAPKREAPEPVSHTPTHVSPIVETPRITIHAAHDAPANRMASHQEDSRWKSSVLSSSPDSHHAAATPHTPVSGGGVPKPGSGVTSEVVVISSTLSVAMESMGDAPACDVCGTITVRSGTCYKCLNCGASMGCS